MNRRKNYWDQRLAPCLGIVTVLISTTTALSCPFCDSESGANEVKAAILGDDFWFHLFCMALPLGVLLGLTALIHVGLPQWPFIATETHKPNNIHGGIK